MVEKILITGVSGLLGGYLFRIIREEYGPGYQDMVRGTWCSTQVDSRSCYRMDVTDLATVQRVITRFGPHVIIHCAAIGSVDYCEKNYAASHKVNVDGTKNVASVARNIGAKLVYVSSNAVYEGDNPPYTEKSVQRPVNKYGWQKKDAEEYLVRTIGKSNLLTIRPIMLYGWNHPLGRGNWATKLLNWFGKGQIVRMVNDVITQPTYAYDCAQSIWALIRRKCSGSWNIGGMDCMTLYQFAQHITIVFDLQISPGHLIAVPSSQFPAMATRPQNTTYDMSKLYGLADDTPAMGDALLPRGVDKGLAAMRRERR